MNKLFNSIYLRVVLWNLENTSFFKYTNTRSMKTRIAISLWELKPALYFWSLVQNQQTKVYQSSRHVESYLNFPAHLDLKILSSLLPQLLHTGTSPQDCAITYYRTIARNQISNLGMILNAWISLWTVSLTGGKRILSIRAAKGKIIGLSWCQKYDRNHDFLNAKRYISLPLRLAKYWSEMHVLFNLICSLVILVTKNIKEYTTKMKFTVH